MKYILSILLICCLSSAAFTQSVFKAEPKPIRPYALVRGLVAAAPSTADVWRFITNIAAYGEPGHNLMAGAGFGFQHQTFDQGSQKWICQYSINALAWAGGTVAPTVDSQPSLLYFGPMVGIFNNKLMLGAAYNPGADQGRKILAVVAIGINLNN